MKPPRHYLGWVTRWARGLAALMAGTVLLAGTLLLLLAAWVAYPQSLGPSLRWAQSLLGSGSSPLGTLQVSDVQGSWLRGGHIGHLRWQRDQLSVDITNMRWSWPANFWATLLWQRGLHLADWQAQRVALHLTPSDGTPLRPPTHLQLPWLHTVQWPWRIEQLQLHTAVDLTFGPLQGEYRYQATTGHTLQVPQLDWADGRYAVEAHVQTQAPLKMQLHAQGRVATQHLATAVPWLQAEVRAEGDLAPANARITVTAHAQSEAPNARPPQLQATFTVTPWARLPVHAGQWQMQNWDLAAFWPQAPHTRLAGHGQLSPPTTPTAQTWQLQGQWQNQRAGPWDQGLLPLRELNATLLFDGQTWQIPQLQARVGPRGQLTAHARPAPTTPGVAPQWQADVQAQHIQPAALWSTLALPALNLSVQARPALAPASGTTFAVQMGPASSPATPHTPQLQGQARLGPEGWAWEHAELHWLDMHLRSQGRWQHAPHQRQKELTGELTVQLPGTQCQWQQTHAEGFAQCQTTQAQQTLPWLQATLGQARQWWPAMAQRWPLPPWLPTAQMQGAGHISATWQGPPWAGGSHLRWPATWKLQLELPHWRVGEPTATGPTTGWTLQEQQIHLQGQHTDWQFSQRGSVQSANGRFHSQVQAQGRFTPAQGWGAHTARLTSAQLKTESPAPGWATQWQLQGSPEWTWHGPDAFALGAAGLQATLTPPDSTALPPLQLQWDTLRWGQGTLHTRGQAQGVALQWLAHLLNPTNAPQGPLAQAGLAGNVQLQAQWDATLPLRPSATPATPQASFSLRHTTGDLSWRNGSGPERLPVGLEELSSQWTLRGTALQGQLRWHSRNAGRIDAQLNTQLAPPQPHQTSWQWPEQAPVSGRVDAHLPQIGLWSQLAPPGWRVQGAISTQASLSGTRQTPQWQGTLQAQNLGVRSLLDGIEFNQGELQARLQGERITIERLRLQGAGGDNGGWLQGHGSAQWATLPPATRPSWQMQLQLQAQALRLLARADRRLSLSGNVAATLQQGQLQVQGALSTDQATILLPDDTTPTLGDDVVIRHSAPRNTTQRTPLVTHRMALDLDLGPQFLVKGRGLNTYLQGQLHLEHHSGQDAPRLSGQVSTRQGTYRAYGQTLTIEEGTVRFNGPYDNPSLDILALRPHPSQKVGVQVSGTATAPRVRLYADPDLPDSEKLAWLVLGRPATGAGAETALLQQAALALITSRNGTEDNRLARLFGLDEISLRGESTKADGSPHAAAVTLGKRLTDQLYVSYSRSVLGLVGTVAVLFDVSRHFTLRAQAGDDNAVDLIFTHKFDGQPLPATMSGAASP